MRGLDADQVYTYLDQLADQVAAMERELGEVRAQNERLKAEFWRVRSELDEYEQVGDRVNEQVVQLFSQAQLIAEEMVEDVSRDARERIGQAREHERKIVEQAMQTAGQEVQSYARSAQDQMQSIMESFASEVNRLGSLAATGESSTGTTRHRTGDPLFDDPADWQQPGSRRASGHSPGTD